MSQLFSIFENNAFTELLCSFYHSVLLESCRFDDGNCKGIPILKWFDQVSINIRQILLFSCRTDILFCRSRRTENTNMSVVLAGKQENQHMSTDSALYPRPSVNLLLKSYLQLVVRLTQLTTPIIRVLVDLRFRLALANVRSIAMSDSQFYFLS